MNGLVSNKLKLILAGFIMASVLLLPEIKLSSSFPTIQFIDIILPFVILILFIERKFIEISKFYFIAIAFFFYILFTIFLNNRQESIRDFFELYKLLKWIIVALYFSRIDAVLFSKQYIKPIFLIIVIANMLHYFNIFNFNYIVEHYYAGGVHIKTFGLNSLGQPTYKRMLGLSANPNINSMVFSFFSVLFFPKKNKDWKEILWFIIAVLMLFLCQSRTNLLALAMMFLFTVFYKRSELKYMIRIVFIVVGVYLGSMLIASSSYLNSLFVEKINNHTSIMGRMEVWSHLLEMIKEKPFFGHGPNKDYFYDNNLYSENEYVLQTWRYGFIGLAIFLSLIFTPMISAFKNATKKYSLEIIQLTIFYMINSLTNNPFTDRITVVLFAIMVGIYFNNSNKESSHE
ncbi:O-antigen ligase family protein [Flavobacteriales bacterium]|nr:O-antigen ligase family protein [Flavobacteriales bacterium]